MNEPAKAIDAINQRTNGTRKGTRCLPGGARELEMDLKIMRSEREPIASTNFSSSLAYRHEARGCNESTFDFYFERFLKF